MRNTETHNFFHNMVEIVFTKLLSTLEQIGLFGHFFIKVIIGIFQSPSELKEIWKQCYLIGYKSLPLVGITGFIMGVVLTFTI
jgi:phospholipid/cholesterol/gamma-HCH transport system permease protein